MIASKVLKGKNLFEISAQFSYGDGNLGMNQWRHSRMGTSMPRRDHLREVVCITQHKTF